MTTATTRQAESTASPVLMMAFELAEKYWKLGFTTGSAQRARRRQILARDVERLEREIAAAKRRFGLAADVPVVSCYEAGREGFWLHRWLVAHGVQSLVVDSSSIEVKRRARRTKTDRVDLDGLLRLLARHLAGERHAWSVVHVPSVTAEDTRHVERELEDREAGSHADRESRARLARHAGRPTPDHGDVAGEARRGAPVEWRPAPRGPARPVAP